MRRVIMGKLYDTDKAELVAETEARDCYCGDFDWWSERLYRTPSGSWFLSGRGGYRTIWSTPGLIVQTEDQAREWLERYHFTDEYLAHFGAVEA